jgi:hypothetical protein
VLPDFLFGLPPLPSHPPTFSSGRKLDISQKKRGIDLVSFYLEKDEGKDKEEEMQM